MTKVLPPIPLRFLAAILAVAAAGAVLAQGPRPARVHTATEARPVHLLPASETPPGGNRVEILERGAHREVRANGIPSHPVGPFPNRANPNRITAQDHDFMIPSNPKSARHITPGRQAGGPFGIALNGVLFEPGTAEFWKGDRTSGWNYEALGGAVTLGLDANHAHVQPTGNYHYHGLPTLLMKRLGYREGEHSPQIGWAADGFPIYARYGYRDPDDPASGVIALRGSYRLRTGQRPGGEEPGGPYDGAFVQDYEYVAGLGDLDECNGRFCLTPEFPEGTYAYFLTENWPVIPRYFRGTPTTLRAPGAGIPPGGGRVKGPHKGPPKGRGGPKGFQGPPR